MIHLHSFGPSLGLIDPSPFVLKVDAYLRMADIDFNHNLADDNFRHAPKGKLPFIRHGQQVIADSQFIIQYLKSEFGDSLDSELNGLQQAQAHLITKSFDENLYFVLLYSRWHQTDSWQIVRPQFFKDVPALLKWIVPGIVRKQICKTLYRQGIARHSMEEVLQICRHSFQSISDLLTEKKYFFGDKPSSLDATLFAFLAQFILAELDNPFNELARSYPALTQYTQRIYKQYYLQ